MFHSLWTNLINSSSPKSQQCYINVFTLPAGPRPKLSRFYKPHYCLYLQNMIYLMYVCSLYVIIILSGFLFMCMTRQAVFCMNTSIHPQGTIKHLSPTAEVCLRAETHTAQPSKCHKKIGNYVGKQFPKDLYTRLWYIICLLHCYGQVNFYHSEYFHNLSEIRGKRGLRGLENPTGLVMTDKSSAAQPSE